MRVLHVCPTYFSADSFIAGGERYSYGLATAMARATPTTLVTFGDKAFERKDGALTVRCYRRWTYVYGSRANPLSALFLKDVLAADVVHCHQFMTVASDIAILGGAAARKKVFITDLAGSASFSLSYHMPLWRTVRAFLHISEFNRALFPQIPPAKKKLIYGGVDTDEFRPGIDANARSKRILFCGRLMPHKGVDLLLDALDPDMELDVVGQSPDPAYYASLKAKAAGKRVRFLPETSDAQLLEMYRTCARVAIPSLLDGGYTTALEAMACETPVVGTQVGSLPELVTDGETGFIVAPSDPSGLHARLRTLFDDRALANRMGRAGRERVLSTFTWDRVVERCLREYAS
jgi:glycosyltransferase involved in cell wall biosynthesis